MDYVKQEIYNLDGNTQLEFLDRKTIIVIDKDRFSVCKQLYIENAPDEDYATFLNIPVEKVRFFKYKMQLFEDSIRARRRAAKLQKKRTKKVPIRKREISSEERFRRARELIARNYSTNQISKILKVSERSVTRFKRRMREEKQRLKAEGKIVIDPNDPDDEGSFRHLKPEEKIKAAQELFRKRLKIHEISEILKISERSVRRWKDRLMKIKKTPSDVKQEEIDDDQEEVETKKLPDRAARSKAIKIEDLDEEEDAQDLDFQAESTEPQPAKKKRRMYVDEEKVQYARELIENKLSNKEMSLLLEMSIACVRKLKSKILDGTVDELIDNSAECYTKLEKVREESKAAVNVSTLVAVDPAPDPDADPLNLLEASYYSVEPSSSAIPYGYERKPKAVLRDREMYLARLLRENNIRTMDIAKMMKISERSVTRLLAKSREMEVIEYDADVVAEAEKLLADKDEILNSDIVVADYTADPVENFESPGAKEGSKRQLGLSLLAMNVKVKDISKMLDVCEKTVARWKARMHVGGGDDDEDHSVFSTRSVKKEENVDSDDYD